MAYTSYPSTLLTGGAANTKGSYAQIVAATPYASSRLYLSLLSSTAAPRFFLVDLATGAAGAETVVVANVAVNCDIDFISGTWVPVDVDIPAATRLAARCQSVTGASGIICAVLLDDRALGSLAAPMTFGTNTAASRGTQVDPGTTINTKGAYVALSASTAARIDALALCVTAGAQGQALTAFTIWRLDLATGAAGAETVVVPDVPLMGNANWDTPRPALIRLAVSIPAGSRLAVRCQCDRNAALERLLCVTLIGMQEPTVSVGAGTSSVAYLG